MYNKYSVPAEELSLECICLYLEDESINMLVHRMQTFLLGARPKINILDSGMVRWKQFKLTYFKLEIHVLGLIYVSIEIVVTNLSMIYFCISQTFKTSV